MGTIVHTQTTQQAPSKPKAEQDLLRLAERSPIKVGSLTPEAEAALVGYALTHIKVGAEQAERADAGEARILTLSEQMTAAREDVRIGTRAATDARAVVARVVFVIASNGERGASARLTKALALSKGEVSKYNRIGAAMARTGQTSGSAYRTFREAIDRTGTTTVVDTIVANALGQAEAAKEGDSPARVSLEHLTHAVAEVAPAPVKATPEVKPVKVTSVTSAVRAQVDRVTGASKRGEFIGDAADLKYLQDAIKDLTKALEGAKVSTK